MRVVRHLCLRYHRRVWSIVGTVTAAWRYAKRNGRRQPEIGKRQQQQQQQPRRTTFPGRQQQRHRRRIRPGHGERFGDGKRPGTGSGHRCGIARGVGEGMCQYGTNEAHVW